MYIEFTKYDLTTSVYGKRHKIVMRKPQINEKTKTNVINSTKQYNAFVPNFVHSMDGSNIFLLVDELIKNRPNMNIATIHDCFGTSANDADYLANLVKEAFIKVYVNKDFVERFHNFILDYVKNTYKVENGEITYEKSQTKGMEKITIPDIPKLTERDSVLTKLKKSKYFIN